MHTWLRLVAVTSLGLVTALLFAGCSEQNSPILRTSAELTAALSEAGPGTTIRPFRPIRLGRGATWVY